MPDEDDDEDLENEEPTHEHHFCMLFLPTESQPMAYAMCCRCGALMEQGLLQ